MGRPALHRVCEIDGCEGPVKGRGWCSKHLQRFYAHGTPHHEPSRPGPAPCSIAGCEKPSTARGWCSTHYQRWRDHGDPNRAPNHACRLCGRRQHGLGLCTRHYFRWRDHGDPFYDGQTFVFCGVATCWEPATSLGKYANLCIEHRRRAREFGDPLGSGTTVRPMGERLPLEPLERLLASLGGVGAALSAAGLEPESPERERHEQRRKRALDEGAWDVAYADEFAVKALGMHPALVWGEDWWTEDIEDVDDEELEAA